MAVPYFNLAVQHRAVRPAVEAAVRRVLASGQYVLGEEGRQLEQAVARACGARFGVGVANGTDALHLGLRALGVGPGDEVITSPLTFIATIEAILMIGARPVLADIDPVTCTLDPAQVRRRLTRRTKALLPVHLYGQAADMAPLLGLARRRGLVVLEDAAQALGARYRGRPVGGLGDAGAISFYPTKNLGGYGDSGMVVTNSAAVARRLRTLRNHGASRPHHHTQLGVNSRLDELQAAALRVKLRRLARWHARRRRLANLYMRLLTPIPEVTPPVEAPGRTHIYHIYAVRVPAACRDALRRSLAGQGIGTMRYYPRPVHLQPAMRRLGYRRGSFPHAERAVRELVALPLYPELPDSAIRTVASAVQRFFR